MKNRVFLVATLVRILESRYDVALPNGVTIPCTSEVYDKYLHHRDRVIVEVDLDEATAVIVGNLDLNGSKISSVGILNSDGIPTTFGYSSSDYVKLVESGELMEAQGGGDNPTEGDFLTRCKNNPDWVVIDSWDMVFEFIAPIISKEIEITALHQMTDCKVSEIVGEEYHVQARPGKLCIAVSVELLNSLLRSAMKLKVV